MSALGRSGEGSTGTGLLSRPYTTRFYLFMFALMLIVPMLLLAGILTYGLLQAEQRRFQQSAVELARNSAVAVEREILSVTTALEVLGLSEALARNDLQSFHQRAVRVAALQGSVIGLRDRSSRHLIITSIPFGSPLPETSRLVELDRAVVQSRKPLVSNYFSGLIDKKPWVGVVIPILRDGEVAYVLSASIPTSRIREALRQELPAGWISAVVDRDGIIIARTADPDMGGTKVRPDLLALLNSNAESWIGVNSFGEDAYAALQKTSFDWTIVSGGPEELWRSTLRPTMAIGGAGALLLVVFGFCAAYVLAKRIHRPFTALAGRSQELARGEIVSFDSFNNLEANILGRSLSSASSKLARQERALMASELRYQTLFDVIDDGFCIIDVIFDDQGKAVDYRFVEQNPAFERQTGLTGAIGRTAKEMIPDLEPRWFELYGRVAQTGKSVRFEEGSEPMGRWFDVFASKLPSPNANLVAVVFQDISQRRRAEMELRVSEARFRAIQETSIDGFMVFESLRNSQGIITDFIWRYANEAAEKMIGRPKADFIGRRLLVEMPGNREEGLFDAYVKVVETGEPWTHEFSYMHEGVNAYVRLVAAKTEDGFAVSFADLSERRRAEEKVRESQLQLAAALKAGQLGVYDYDLKRGTASWDSTVRALWGVEEDAPITSDLVLPGIHPEDFPNVQRSYAEAIDPKGSRHYAAEYRVINRKDHMHRWIVAEGDVEFEGNTPVRLLGTIRDVTRRKLAEIQRELLINELNHRVKNTLATVQSFAVQSFRPSERPIESQLKDFEDRLFALSRAHDALTKQNWAGASLDHVIVYTLQPHERTDRQSRFKTGGPHVMLKPSQVLAMSMAFHELATNAIKYGALSVEEGWVSLRWSEESGRLHIEWQERDGPKVVPPTRKGFGSRLLTKALQTELNGNICLNFDHDGVRCVIEFPL